jgi:hypothetical protein
VSAFLGLIGERDGCVERGAALRAATAVIDDSVDSKSAERGVHGVAKPSRRTLVSVA